MWQTDADNDLAPSADEGGAAGGRLERAGETDDREVRAARTHRFTIRGVFGRPPARSPVKTPSDEGIVGEESAGKQGSAG